MLRLSLVATAAIMGLSLGDKVHLSLPDMRPEDGKRVAGNLILGALEPHAELRADDKTQVDLVAKRPCSCFGKEVAAKAKVATLTFPDGLSEDQRLAMAGEILAGKHADSLTIAIPGAAAPAAPAGGRQSAPGQQQTEPGQQPHGNQAAASNQPAGPATAGGNRQS